MEMHNIHASVCLGVPECMCDRVCVCPCVPCFLWLVSLLSLSYYDDMASC